MELTEIQKGFLDEVCYGRGEWDLNENGEVDTEDSVDMSNRNLTEIPIKFGKVKGNFWVGFNNLTTLKNLPNEIDGLIDLEGNNLTEYFKNLKEEDFPHWDKLDWDVVKNYQSLFIVMLRKSNLSNNDIIEILNDYPLPNLYLE